jgi:N-acyl-L-homoserine lactone synthetase
MTVRIRLAQTTDELDQVFALRHRVMVDDERYFPQQPGARLADRFDAYPTTANVIAIAVEEDRIIGGIRFVERTPAGTSADAYFDFRPFLPAAAREVAAGMIVVERAYRGTPRLVFAMFGMGYHWAIHRGATHVVAPANPRRRPGMLRSGYRMVAPQFQHEHSGLPVVPMVLDLKDLEDRALAFLRRQRIQHWLQSFERQFHSAGDVVLRRGEPGDAVYVVVDGHASVLTETGEVRAELGAGDLFGELALVTGLPRTADVVARTDLDLMVLDRASFHMQLRANPRASERMLELLARRMAAMLSH